VCDVEIEEIMPGTTTFEVLTTTHKSIFSKDYATAEILDQFTGDLYIFLTVDEMKNFKKETYTMKVTLKTADAAYEVFAENDGYLIVR
jgi:DnaJ-class molecular chaperone